MRVLFSCWKTRPSGPRARAVAADIAQLPDVAGCVTVLEGLVALES